MASFSSFALSKTMVSALNGLGYVNPSPVQERVIPKVLRGMNLLCQSETGSGKTHAYLAPIIDRLDLSLGKAQAILIAPSRELARQIYDFAREFLPYFPKLKIRLFTSSDDISENEAGLSLAPQLLIGTPGRLRDLLLERHPLDLHLVKTLVLDEADMLLQEGYFDDIDALREALSESLQILVFSATLSEHLRSYLGKYAQSDFLYESEEKKTPSRVAHHLVDIRHANSNDALLSFLRIKNPYLAMVFASTKEKVQETYAFLKKQGYATVLFSGDLDVRERRKAIRLIKDNRYQIICCSDLLARGIDIEDVSDVISLDLPKDLSYYHHRAGRTARFGKSGDSYVFYDQDHAELARQLLAQGVKFDFLILKNGVLSEDTVGLLPKRKLSQKKKVEDPEERKAIAIAKAKTRTDKVKPGYKKKTRLAEEKVKKAYRLKAIKKKIRQSVYGKKEK